MRLFSVHETLMKSSLRLILEHV